MKQRSYFTYIITNKTKTVLYTGITNNLAQRLIEHYLERGKLKTFTGRYNSYYLLYYETFSKPMEAIRREKQIKAWTRKKKEDLIESENPDWKFLNSEIMPWPDDDAKKRGED